MNLQSTRERQTLLSKGKWQGGKNAYDLVPGFRELCEFFFSVKLGQKPTAEEIWDLLDRVDHIDQKSPIPDQPVLDLLRGTGLHRRIPLRTVLKQQGVLRPKGPVIQLQLGGNANEMQRRIKLMLQEDLSSNETFAMASDNRHCNTRADIDHPAVMAFQTKYGRYPYEWVCQMRLMSQAGYLNRFRPIHVHDSIEENVRELFTKRPVLAQGRIVVFVSPPKPYLALVVRRVISEVAPEFDTREDQFWFCQGELPLAVTAAQANNPAKYIRPLDILPAVINLVLEFYLLSGGKPLQAAN